MLKVFNKKKQKSFLNNYLFNLVRMLREELQLLQEQGSLVGEVVKAMDKKKVLVKVNQNILFDKKQNSF
jgi:ATP-dependent 26S proteasome regulatory subunit